MKREKQKQFCMHNDLATATAAAIHSFKNTRQIESPLKCTIILFSPPLVCPGWTQSFRKNRCVHSCLDFGVCSFFAWPVTSMKHQQQQHRTILYNTLLSVEKKSADTTKIAHFHFSHKESLLNMALFSFVDRLLCSELCARVRVCDATVHLFFLCATFTCSLLHPLFP